MTLGSFLHYVELRTKLASMLPLLLGTLYTLWAYQQLDPINLFLMALSLLCIDMATTASNHYTDFMKAVQTEGYNYERHNTLVRDGISLKTSFRTIALLVAAGVVFGLLLVLRTDWVVLFIGGLAFGVGLLYSWGPVPISRTPLSEAVSGFFMGFVIVFLSTYIHVFQLGWVHLGLSGPVLNLDLNLYEILHIFAVSFPLICGISNIMLSNNLCDLEEDRVNGRQTLPILIGLEWGLRLSRGLYLAQFLGILLDLLMGWIPSSCGVVFLAAFPVFKASKRFSADPSKEKTFVLSVKSFLWVAGMYCLGMGIGVWLL